MTVLAGVIPTRTSTTAEFGLGNESDSGTITHRYVKAAAAIAAGDAVMFATGDADEPHAVTPTTAVNQPVAGIAPVAIASGSFGWIVVRGKVAAAKVAASTAAGAQLGTSAVAGTLSTITIAAAYAQAEVQRALAAAAGRSVQAIDAEASGLAEVYVA